MGVESDRLWANPTAAKGSISPLMSFQRGPAMRILPAVTLLSCMVVTSGARSGDSRELTFEERVEAQRVIERVYYSHQIGTTKSFEEAVPRPVLEKEVATYLKQSLSLPKLWRTPVTTQALRQEM